MLSKLFAFLFLKETLGFDWVFVFWRPKNLDFLYFAVSVPCFIRLWLWWKCALWIDDNMHWALIDLFCDTLFYTWISGFCVLLSSGLLPMLSKRVLDMSFYLRSVVPFFNWLHCDDIVRLELMILWALIDLFCDTLCIRDLKFSAVAFEWLATIAFRKSYMQFWASGKTSAGLGLSFFGELNVEVFPLRSLFRFLIDFFVMKLCP